MAEQKKKEQEVGERVEERRGRSEVLEEYMGFLDYSPGSGTLCFRASTTRGHNQGARRTDPFRA